MKFSEASNGSELITTLKEKAKNEHSSSDGKNRYFYHYTKASAVIAIMRTKKWYIGSPKNMNDGLEKIHLEENNVDNLFFASFLTDEKENIGMWSMYSQPWEDGAIVRIPVRIMKEWMEGNPVIYEAIKDSKESTSNIISADVFLHSIAYSNVDSKDATEKEELVCGGQKNSLIVDVSNKKELAGYIKDNAWAYEKEIRLRVEVSSQTKYDAVSIEVPQKVLDSIDIITGPRFERNLLSIIRDEVDGGFNANRIIPSLFTGRLKWVYCDSCNYKKQNVH